MQASACLHPSPATMKRREHPVECGDETFQHLYEAHWLEVRNYIAHRIGSVPDAEDLAQETFLLAYQHIETYAPNLPAPPWLLRIAANLVVNHLRDQQAQKRTTDEGPTVSLAWSDDEDLVHDEPDHRELLPEDNAILREMSDRIDRLVVNLPEEDRQMVETLYFDSLSQREAAEAFQIPRRTVRDRNQRLLKMLRTQLESDPAA